MRPLVFTRQGSGTSTEEEGSGVTSLHPGAAPSAKLHPPGRPHSSLGIVIYLFHGHLVSSADCKLLEKRDLIADHLPLLATRMSVLHFAGVQDALVNEEACNPERHEVRGEAAHLSPDPRQTFRKGPQMKTTCV